MKYRDIHTIYVDKKMGLYEIIDFCKNVLNIIHCVKLEYPHNSTFPGKKGNIEEQIDNQEITDTVEILFYNLKELEHDNTGIKTIVITPYVAVFKLMK